MIRQAKNVLVTGAVGFLGYYVSKYYTEQGWQVVGLDTVSIDDAHLVGLSSYHKLHLPDPELKSILKSCNFDLCIHCAGNASVHESMNNPSLDFQSNTVVTFELLNEIRLNSPATQVIILSSAAVYGNPEYLPISEDAQISPLSPYGFHKLQCELLCEEFSSIYGLSTASARIFSAYGPGLRRQVIWDVFYKALTEPVIKLQGTGGESRDFIHAEDIAYAIATIADNALMEGEVYNVATSSEVSISDLAKLIATNLSFDGTIEFDGKVPLGVPLNWQSDISKLESLGFISKVSLDQGIKQFSAWVNSEINST